MRGDRNWPANKTKMGLTRPEQYHIKGFAVGPKYKGLIFKQFPNVIINKIFLIMLSFMFRFYLSVKDRINNYDLR